MVGIVIVPIVRDLTKAFAAAGCFALLWIPAGYTVIFRPSDGRGPM